MIDQPVTGIGEVPFASMGDLGLDKAKVIQCALSRICGICAQSLGRPIAFLGSSEEAERNEFHFPPAHLDCAELALQTWARDWSASLGHPSAPRSWTLVTTSGFEFIRMNDDSADRRPVFSPNSLLDTLPR